MKTIKTAFTISVIAFVASLLFPNYGLISNSFAEDLGCPAPAIVVTGDAPDGRATWCEIDDEKNGPFRVFYPDGKLKIETHFKSDKQDGKYLFLDELGQVRKEGQYLRDKMTGAWTRYYGDGSFKDKGSWIDSKPDGYWRLYRKGGELEEEGYYQDGEAICLWRTHAVTGEERYVEKKLPKENTCEDLVPYEFVPKLPGEPRYWQDTRETYSLNRVSLSGISVNQKSGGASRSLMLGYNPERRISGSFDWVSSIGLSRLKSRSGGLSSIPILNMTSGLRYYFSKPRFLYSAVQLGLQTWLEVGTYFSPALSLGFDPRWKNVLLFASWQPVFLQNNITSEVHLGVEFGFSNLKEAK